MADRGWQTKAAVAAQRLALRALKAEQAKALEV
jgi:hypothetical protein